MPEHTVKSYEAELKQLHKSIEEMGGRVQTQFDNALAAIASGSEQIVDSTVERDREIDDLDRSLAEKSVLMLALRQPVADDLRQIVAAIKISGDLERIGDLVKNVAKRATILNSQRRIATTRRLLEMNERVRNQLRRAIQAYVDEDAELAIQVRRQDVEVDDSYHGVFRELLTYMLEDPRLIGVCTHLLFVAKNLERVGDHCVHIAETVHYLATGEFPSDPRPKGEDTSHLLVEPSAGG